MKITNKRTFLVTGAVVLLILIVVSLLIGVYRETQEINIESGRARYRIRIVGLVTSERIEDTAISLALDEPTSGNPDEAWRMVFCHCPPLITISPHYTFHGALWQTRMVDQLFQVLQPDKSRRREIAAEVLRRWQEDGDYFGVSEYLIQLEQETSQEPASTSVDSISRNTNSR